MGVYEVGYAQRCATAFALVAVSLFAAMGTCAGNISVGEKFVGFGIVGLLGCLYFEFTLVVQPFEKFGGCGAVDVGCRARVDVETYAKLSHGIAYYSVVAVHDVLWSNALFAGLDGDRHTMLVTAADHNDFLAFEAQVTRIDVGGNIHACEVSDMHRSVGVGQGGGYESTVEFLFHY